MPALRVIGPGRAGRSLAAALDAAGWRVLPLLGRSDDLGGAAQGADVVVLATPDAVVARVAAAVAPGPAAVVHLSGSLGLDALAPHARRGSVHPLVALPDAATGAVRLRGAWFAVAGDPVASEVVAALGGRAVPVGDDDRALYHAAACSAANHLVALLGSVERMAAAAGVPLEAYLDLAQGALDDVRRAGPAAALTGPVSRGDWDTVARHLAALPAAERAAYATLADLAARLAGREAPADLRTAAPATTGRPAGEG